MAAGEANLRGFVVAEIFAPYATGHLAQLAGIDLEAGARYLRELYAPNWPRQ